MLSKRASDIIFVGIMILVVIGIVVMRFIVLGTMDERIEEVESENQQIQDEIMGLQGMVGEHRDTEMPSRSELNQRVPAIFSEDQLRFYVNAQLELAGILDSQERSVDVEISQNPNISGGSYGDAANQFDIVRVGIDIETNDIDEVRQFIDQMYEINQVFVLQNIRYDVPDEDEYVELTVNLLTFYDLD